MMKLSDYVFDFMSEKLIDTIFSVSGGAAAHLLNSVAERNDFKFICNYHEQSCAMAAESYARLMNKPACVLLTNGPGSTNAITGVSGAYGESIPMIIISGQVPTNLSLDILSDDVNLRQLGVQECDIISSVKSMTKYAVHITDPKEIRYHLEKAYYLATTGRGGPVWLDIPLDVQNAQIEIDDLFGYEPPEEYCISTDYDTDEVINLIVNAKKPLIIAGNGIHLSNTENLFLELKEKLQIPVVATWTAKDLIDVDDGLFIGNFGIMGERAANIAVQNSDLLLILGSRLSVPNIGYNFQSFSPDSIKIMVDIDVNELNKPTIKIDLPIQDDLNNFFSDLLVKLDTINLPNDQSWRNLTNSWKLKYPVFQPEYKNNKTKINSFYFMEVLSDKLTDDSIVVTDMGTSFTCSMQSLKMNGHNRLFTSSSQSSMGFGLPGAIGSYFAFPKKNVILIAGDGGFQMNIQELQSVVHYNIPIKMFILNNNGYLAISLMQDNLFNSRYIGSNLNSGVSSPDFSKVSDAYGIKSFKFNDNTELENGIDEVLSYDGPVLCEIMMVENQLLVPRVQSKKDTHGNIKSTTLDDMFPHLSNDEKQSIETEISRI